MNFELFSLEWRVEAIEGLWFFCRLKHNLELLPLYLNLMVTQNMLRTSVGKSAFYKFTTDVDLNRCLKQFKSSIKIICTKIR